MTGRLCCGLKRYSGAAFIRWFVLEIDRLKPVPPALRRLGNADARAVERV